MSSYVSSVTSRPYKYPKNENIDIYSQPGQLKHGYDGSLLGVPNFNPKGSMGKLSDNNNQYGGSTVNINNYYSIHHSYFHQSSERFPFANMHFQTLAFLITTGSDPAQGVKAQFEVASVHMVNAYLFSQEGRQMYGGDTTCERLLQDFRFAGSYAHEIPATVAQGDNHVATIVTQRRARIQAITRAHHPRGAPIVDKLLTRTWLLCQRRSYILEDNEALENRYKNVRRSALNNMDVEIDDNNHRKKGDKERSRADSRKVGIPDPFYWSFTLYNTNHRGDPDPWLYCDDDGSGSSLFIGTIGDYTPSDKYNGDETRECQQSLSGSFNTISEPRAYNRILPLQKTVDLYIRTR